MGRLLTSRRACTAERRTATTRNKVHRALIFFVLSIGQGVEKKIILDGLDESQVVKQFQELVASDVSHGSGMGRGDKL